MTEIPFQRNDTQCAVVDNVVNVVNVVDNVFPKSVSHLSSMFFPNQSLISHLILYFCRQDQSGFPPWHEEIVGGDDNISVWISLKIYLLLFSSMGMIIEAWEMI